MVTYGFTHFIKYLGARITRTIAQLRDGVSVKYILAISEHRWDVIALAIATAFNVMPSRPRDELRDVWSAAILK